jgi:hypothetical protein
VKSAWQSKLPRLLIFDNCEEEELLAGWRPATGGCRVLVTSRRQQWDPMLGVKTLPLDVLSPDESVALLHEHRPNLPEDDSDLNAIVRELGGLPLALHLAGSYLWRTRFDVEPKDYLVRLRSPDLLQHPSLWEAKGISPTSHVQSVARTFMISYKRLDAADPTDRLAVALLARVAHFAPGEPIPRDLLRATLNLPGDDPDAPEAGEALNRLAELGLIETDEEGR